jgi:outer membrane protein OmpA-like peptidoglycan-associated protein
MTDEGFTMRCILPIALLAALSATSASAEATRLNVESDRITDDAVHADHEGYAAVQERIHALNEGGRPVRDYHLSKAQCWLDVSFHEYTRNDRSAFTQGALDESVKLVAAMEGKVEPLPMETPLVNDAARLRPDLWEKFAGLKQHAGFRCAQQLVACAEAELVHAGNEYNQQQWRHARPYVQIAEENTAEAQRAAEACVPPTPALPAPVTLSADVAFEFDRHTQADVRSFDALTAALDRARQEKLSITAIELVGHADRLAGRGAEYNRWLSERRAATIAAWLGTQGIEASLLRSSYRGDSEQVKACEGVTPPSALHECLLPNRRVEVRITAVPQQ